MLEDVLKSALLREVFERSHFKKGQLDSLLVKRYAKVARLRTKDVLTMKDVVASEGSLQRSAGQAKRVISKSVATLILALDLDLMEESVVDSIPRVAGVLAQSTVRNLSEDELRRLTDLLDVIIKQSSRR